MKYINLKELTIGSPLYLIVAKEAHIREEAVSHLLKHTAQGDMSVRTFDGSRVQIEELFQEFDTLSFFSKKRIVVLHRLEEMPKPLLKRLESYLSSPHPDVCLIMDAGEINRATNIFKLSEKNGVVLDVPEEKPWEKQRSMQSWLLEQAGKHGCSMAADAAHMMVQQLGTDGLTLSRELEKLVLYIGGRTQITLSDVQAVCGAVNTHTAWQLGDALVQRNAAEALKIGTGLLDDGVSFFQLIRQIRSQFQTKYQVCSLLTNGGSPADVACEFPYMKGRILDQNCRMAHGYGMARFQKAMLKIDETEAMAKSVTADEYLLTERLIAELT